MNLNPFQPSSKHNLGPKHSLATAKPKTQGSFNNKSVQAEKKKSYFQTLISKAKSIFRTNNKKDPEQALKKISQGSLESLKTSFPKNLEELDAQIHTLEFLSTASKLSRSDKRLVLSKLYQLKYLKEEGPLSEKSYQKMWSLKQDSFHSWAQQNVPPLKQRQASKLIDGYFDTNRLSFDTAQSKEALIHNLNKAQSEMISLLYDYSLIDTDKTPKESIHKSLIGLSEAILSKSPKTKIKERLYFENKDHKALKLNQLSSPLGECLPCSMVKTEKLTNAWKSELKTDKGEVIMANYRHATLCAFGEGNKKTREKLNLERAEELVMNMIDIQAIEEQILARTQDHNADFIIPIVSNNLESADNLRGLANKLLNNDRSQAMNERRHIREQTLALQQACKNKTVEIEIPGIGPVKIIPQVLAFNFGVNEFALKTGVTKIGSTWENAKTANQEAMEALLGEHCLQSSKNAEDFGGLVGDFLAKSKDGKKNAIVKALASQVATMYKEESYKTAGQEPYKMVSRLSVLSHLIGAKVCTNCKSGKDRTSMAVAEANYLAMLIHRDKELPKPDQALNTKQRQELGQFVFGKTHYEIQAHNRGAKGYKLGGIPALNKRVIGEDNPLFQDLFEGLAYTT